MKITPRVIKKYPNRRLYDTTASIYITLDDIRQFVLNHTAFRVTDAKSGEDLTNIILLQVISSQESGHTPFLTTEILQGIIRFHDNPLQKPMREFIEKAFSFAAEHKDTFERYIKTMQTPSPDAFTRLAQQNMDLWKTFFKQPDEKDKNH